MMYIRLLNSYTYSYVTLYVLLFVCIFKAGTF